MLEQTNVNDQQEFLERMILKTNLKTFLQTSILSVENYKPFMSLSKYERRNFVEEILDIKVFSFMNQIVKTKLGKNREELRIIDVQLKSAFATAKLQKSHIEQIESIKNSNVDSLKLKLQTAEDNRTMLTGNTESLDVELTTYNKSLVELNNRAKQYLTLLQTVERLEKQITETTEKLNDISESVCPTCCTEIHEHKKADLSQPLLEIINVAKNKILICKTKLEELSNTHDQIAECNANIQKINTTISTNNSTVSLLDIQISDLRAEINTISQSEELMDLKYELKKTAENALNLKQKQADLNTEQDYNNAMIELFKDSGIKTKISR